MFLKPYNRKMNPFKSNYLIYKDPIAVWFKNKKIFNITLINKLNQSIKIGKWF